MKISIITIAYNSAETIEDTIVSVVNQSYSNIEYIIVDGGSKDGTLDIIKKYDHQVSKWISEPDKGIYDAMNKGIELASGDFIGILNSDDLYADENVVNDIHAKISTSNAKGIYADLIYVDRVDTNKVIRYWKSGKYKEGQFFKGWMPPHPTFFVAKEVYNEYGKFNLELKSAADYEIMLRFIHKHKIALDYLPRVITRMRVGGVSNQSIGGRLKANQEDRKAWVLNGIKPGRLTLIRKPLSKLIQFLIRN